MDAKKTRTFQIPKDLYEQLEEAARENRRTVTGELLILLEEALRARSSAVAA